MHYIKERSLGEFLAAVGLQLGLQARRCFTRHGGEIEDVALVMHNEVLFISAGEDFLPCRQTDAEALSFACQVMLEEELYHRRLVAENQAGAQQLSDEPSPAAPALARAPAPAPAPAAAGTPYTSALSRTASFGLSVVNGVGGAAAADRWGDPAVAWTAAQLSQVPAHLLEGVPPQSTRLQPSSLQLEPEPASHFEREWSALQARNLTTHPEPEPEPEPEGDDESGAHLKTLEQLHKAGHIDAEELRQYRATLLNYPGVEPEPEPEPEPVRDRQPAAARSAARSLSVAVDDADEDGGDDEAAKAAEQDAILQLLLERETKLMRIYAFYVEHQPPEPKNRPKPTHRRPAGYVSPRSPTKSKRRSASPMAGNMSLDRMTKDTCIKVCSHFELFPSLVSRNLMEKFYDDITEGAGGLTYSQWLELLIRIAETRLGPDGHAIWHESYPTLPAKLSALFDVFMKLK